ncbi:4'-phosphopantetheinyl transferase superfamily protein [Azoarcus sp. TTM-91]|uniref:4'-phosphopantetheinyl transferase family protein n=1 Tax=Azoarcus sp. TTM-91 TaxID=2691581 RepID=UPI00145F6CBA|nr:4'-phosphopantetheinyl transferase superfamily protein [Azoarcus sp. TTM-91]NMG36148.1 4'-phosphopantetheinyl transferase superfamily protein [Azoarcus sp. TTM-91]
MQALPLPETVPAGLEVWMLNLDLAAPLAAGDLALLSQDEQARASRYRRHADRLRAVSGRAALRRLLGARLRRSPSMLRFTANRHGKPTLQEGGAAFNLAHSGECVLIALAGDDTLDAVGVDVERHDDSLDFSALAAYAFTAEERAALAETPHAPTAAFFANWAAKEAVLKAVGVGIAEHLQALSIRRGADGRLDGAHAVRGWPRLRGQALSPLPGYAAAVAWAEPADGDSS